MPHGPRKRPAANVKLEPDSTPSKRKQCSVPAEGTEREEAMPEQGTMPEEDNGAAGAAASLAEASPVPEEGSVPVPKAKAAAAKTMSKPAEELIAPGKEAWKDVHAQCTKLAKQGDNRLRSLGQGKGGWDTEGKEVILVQCIPSMSKKAIHKESLERLQEKETVARGWLTKYQIAKLQQPLTSQCWLVWLSRDWKKGHAT